MYYLYLILRKVIKTKLIYKTMKDWEKKYNKMVEVNEFFGLPYDDLTDKSIKSFISQQRKDVLEEERLKYIDFLERELKVAKTCGETVFIYEVYNTGKLSRIT